jgi:hypothetical protein
MIYASGEELISEFGILISDFRCGGDAKNRQSIKWIAY